MNMKRFVANCLSLPILAIAFAAQAQTRPVRSRGRLSLARSQGQQRDVPHADQRARRLADPQLHDVDLATSKATRRSSTASASTSATSAPDPAQSLRLEASRAGAYRLRFGYRSADAFSALPAFANPLLGQGIIPGQHTFDRTRRMFDVDLELMPDRADRAVHRLHVQRQQRPGIDDVSHRPGRVPPAAGPARTRSRDPRRRQLPLRLGLRTAHEGWRNFRGNESLTLAPGAGSRQQPRSGPRHAGHRRLDHAQRHARTSRRRSRISTSPATS